MNSIIVVLSVFVQLLYGQVYDDTHNIYKTILNSSRYHTEIVPMIDQSEPIYVVVYFNIISIVRVDDITQSFVCNGVLTFNWQDERLMWDPANFGGQEIIHPLPKNIWRPRVVLINTLEDRDLFGDDVSPTEVTYEGIASWTPGSVFSTSCSLSLIKYPFDRQRCTIIMVSMGLSSNELLFVPGVSALDVFSENGEWKLLSTSITADVNPNVNASRFEVIFEIERRPAIYVINIILPVVFLSLLNMLVFCIPVESGEKISYGITVVLAISVFLSLISELLPRSSIELPYVTIYLFSLYIVSVLTVVFSIFIVFLHHIEEKAAFHRRIANRFSGAVDKITKMRAAISPMTRNETVPNKAPTAPLTRTNTIPMSIIESFNIKNTTDQKVKNANGEMLSTMFEDNQEDPGDSEYKELDCAGPSKYKLIGDHIDFFSFIVFILIWLIITLWFFIAVNV